MSFLLCLVVFISGCECLPPKPLKVNESKLVTPYVTSAAAQLPNAENACVKSDFSEIAICTVDASDLLSRSEIKLVGFSDDRKAIFLNIITGQTTQIDLLTKEENALISIPNHKRNRLNEYSDGKWIAWVETEEEVVDLDSGIGKDWSLWAANLEDGEAKLLDCENDNFPKDRHFYAAPDLFDICSPYLAYHGIYADSTDVYRAIVLCNMKTGERKVLACEPLDSGRAFGAPVFTESHLYFGCGYCDPTDAAVKDNEIFQYEISSGILRTIDNPYDSVFSDASEHYLVAEIPWRTDKQTTEIAIFDIKKGEWIRTLDQNSSFLLDSVGEKALFWLYNPTVSNSYVAFCCPTYQQHCLVYDIKENNFYLLSTNKARDYPDSAVFYNDVLFWSGVSSADKSDSSWAKFTVFK